MKGRYPVCCLFLEIDPAAVDVNIHPAKREVKFHREFEIRKFVAQAVQETLLAFHGGESAAASKRRGEPLGGQSTAAPKSRPVSRFASPSQCCHPGVAEFPGKAEAITGN